VFVAPATANDLKLWLPSGDEVDEDIDEIKIDVSQDSNGITVKTVYPEDHAILRIHKGSSYTVDNFG
jgi:hypothetical protein